MNTTNCVLCGVVWKPPSGDIWGPSITSLENMQIKVGCDEYQSFKQAADEYANRHLQRRPNNSIGCLETNRIRNSSDFTASEVLQVVGNQFETYCKQNEIPSFIVSDIKLYNSSYYKRILGKQNEMNEGGDTATYLQTPRVLAVIPNHGIVFVRTLMVNDEEFAEDKGRKIKHMKQMLDKDCIFLWRLLQDLFKGSPVNFTGILVLPNISQAKSQELVCQSCSNFVLFFRHIHHTKQFLEWCNEHLQVQSQYTLTSDLFVSVVTRVCGLYVLLETPQQNQTRQQHSSTVGGSGGEVNNTHAQPPVVAAMAAGGGQEPLMAVGQFSPSKLDGGKSLKHVVKVLMSPQQYEIFTSSRKHRVLFGEYGSGKTQLLIEKVRQTAWDMHYSKRDSIIYLFSFADVEESGKLSLNECLLSHYLMSINKRYSELISPTKTTFNDDLLPPEIHVKVVIASMRQLVRLQEGKTAKIKDIPGFLTQCIASKLKQTPGTLIHIFIDELPYSSFLDNNGSRWQTMIDTIGDESNLWLTSRLPLYLWFQEDTEDENSHILTDFFLEELLRTNSNNNNSSMFSLPHSFQISFLNQVMRSQRPIRVLMREYYNLSKSAHIRYNSAKRRIAMTSNSPTSEEKDEVQAKITSGNPDGTPIWLPMPKCICDDNPALKKKSDKKYCGCFVPRLAFIIDYMLSLLGVTNAGEDSSPGDLEADQHAGPHQPHGEAVNDEKNGERKIKLSDLLICCDTNSLHLLKRLGQALHIVDIDFIIYENDTWTNPHYRGETSNEDDRLEASGSVLGHLDKVLITTTLGSRGLEKKIVVYISPENMSGFMGIVKEKNFIEVVSRSISQVVIITVDDPKSGSLDPASVIDSIESVESVAWPNAFPADAEAIQESAASTDGYSFVGLLRSLNHRGILRESRLPMEEYLPLGLS